MFWAPHLCRICGHIGEISYPIFEKDVDSICKKLKRCLNLEVSRDDLKPKQICNTCFLKLNEYAEFIHNCTLANAKFEELLLFESPQTQFTTHFQKWPETLEMNEKSVIVTSKDNQECAELMMLHQYKHNILENLQTTNLGDIVDMGTYAPDATLKSCALKSSSCNEGSQSVLRHSGTLQKLSESTYEMDERVYDRKRHQYSYYNNGNMKALPDYSSLSDMNITEYTSNFSSGSNTVEVFNELQPNLDKPNETPIETTARPNPDRLTKKQPLFTCADCGKSFVRKLTLRAHTAIHTNIRPFSCTTCQKSFAVRWELKNHQRLHTDMFKCGFCPKNFTTRSKLDRHERVHTDEKPFRCDFDKCGRSFADKRNLVAHAATHSDVREFECGVCGKKWKTRGQLSEHRRVHAEERMYKCGICSVSYKWKNNLRLHMRKHNGYVCCKCGASFGKMSLLAKHRKECDEVESNVT